MLSVKLIDKAAPIGGDMKQLTLIVVVDGKSADQSILHHVRSILLKSGALVQLALLSPGTPQLELCNASHKHLTRLSTHL